MKQIGFHLSVEREKEEPEMSENVTASRFGHSLWKESSIMSISSS